MYDVSMSDLRTRFRVLASPLAFFDWFFGIKFSKELIATGRAAWVPQP